MEIASATGPIREPQLENWREWTYTDYISHFLSQRAAKKRLRVQRLPSQILSSAEFAEFCEPIRLRNEKLYQSEQPRVSIILVAHNEENELLATLVSYTLLDVDPGQAELIVVDNNSTDATAAIIRNCGVRYVPCITKGVGYARDAGVRAVAPSSEYIWLSDGDVRIVPPLKRASDPSRRSSILRTCLEFMDEHPKMLGISSGAVVESAHWSYRAMHSMAVRLNKTRKYSCWSGSNQFIRRTALEAMGGIDVSVSWADDQHRQYQLARYGKRTGMHLSNANVDDSLADPVYYSGRRFATLSLVLRHLRETRTRPVWKRDEFGFPLIEPDHEWRQVRVGGRGAS